MNKKKKILLISGIGVIVLLVLIFIIFKIFDNKRNSMIDMGNIMNEPALKKNAEQQKLHSMILRNATWGASIDDIALEEKGNLLDYSDNYLTVDYETLFDITFLPTYLFHKNKLVAILYEADLSLKNLEDLSTIHQDLSVNIHYVYEQLYKENNNWKTGEARKYDKNLWTNSILNGDLTLQSIWNSNDEKVFLITGKKPLFKFLDKEKEDASKAYMSFVIVSDDYLDKKMFDDLLKITPTETYNSDYDYPEEVEETEQTEAAE